MTILVTDSKGQSITYPGIRIVSQDTRTYGTNVKGALVLIHLDLDVPILRIRPEDWATATVEKW